MIKKYRTIAETLEYGPAITKVILDTGKLPFGTIVKADEFTVNVTRESKDDPDFEWPLFMGQKTDDSMNGTRDVLKAYISDEKGNKTRQGKYITLEMACHPLLGIGSTIKFNGTHNVSVKYDYVITSTHSALKDDVFCVNDGAQWLYSDDLLTGSNNKVTPNLNYVYYIPESEEKIPLVIWLHGAGEGGKEPKIAANANQVINFMKPWAQEIFGGKLSLLAPQAPTMWMDDGTGEYTQDGSTVYLRALDRTIGDFIEEHKDEIDEKRVYIGGDSNGGFMTMKQIIFNPERYAAAFPVCEALADKDITDADIEKIKNIPIWFTHAKNDPVVDPDLCPVPTYKRLLEAGAENVHFTFWDKIEDLTGNWKVNKKPYEYIGHFAWVPMLDNECKLDFDDKPVMLEGKPTTIMEWIAAQTKN
ncbi:MAG: hypothetical protein Q4C42_00155 [Clostridia bacterium]|nr:hypothetical protein [Clostridia bacterium]